jgi:hypothetical protein
MFGQFYRAGDLGKVQHNARDRLFDLDRVSFEEYPPSLSVFPPALTSYVFPLNDDAISHRRPSGTLNGYYLFFEDIEGADAKPGELRAKVGTLRKTTDSDAPPVDRYKDVIWNWVRVGDEVTTGDKKRKVLRIVPPISSKDLDAGARARATDIALGTVSAKDPNRDGARMIGWIELDSKPAK